MTPADDLALIPAPLELDIVGGRIVLGAESEVQGESDRFSNAVDLLREIFKSAPRGDAQPVRFETMAGATGTYELRTTQAGVVIAAADGAAALHAVQTLRQLLPPETESAANASEWSVPCVTVRDAPRFRYRGMHLDVSRHFFDVRFVKRYLDWMARYKLNTFHWHLTDDQGWRIEIKALPRLTEVGAWRRETVVGHTLSRDAHGDGRRHGGYYTQDEVRDVVAYATKLGITVIPEIDVPGHALALLAAYPEYACKGDRFDVATRFGIFADILCTKDATFDMLNVVLGEVAGLFPGPWLHVGGDEALTAEWAGCANCKAVMDDNGLSDTRQLHRYFVERACAIVRSLGKRPAGWDDVLEAEPDELMTVVVWRGSEQSARAIDAGHDVIVAPPEFYFDYFQSDSIDEPLAIHGHTPLRRTYEAALLPAGREDAANVLGGQGTLWTEYIPDASQAEYMAMPRMLALAEQLWSHPSRHSWLSFAKRLRPHFLRLDAMGVNASRSVYHVRSRSTVLEDQKVQVELWSDGDDHDVLFRVESGRGHAAPATYAEPLVFDSAATLHATARDRTTGETFGQTVIRVEPHKAVGRAVRFANAPERLWGDNAASVLVDGITRGHGTFRHAEWAGFEGVAMDAVIDLSEKTTVSSVSIGYDVSRHRRLFAPTAFEVLVSDDADDWRSAFRSDDVPARSERFSATFEAVTTRFLRVIASNTIRRYNEDSSGEAPVSIYIDEVVVH